MNQRLREIINELKSTRRVYTDADFARIVNSTRSELSLMLSGKRPVSKRVVNELLTNFPEINEEWLRTGEGEMLKNVALAENHAVALAADEIRENRINVNTDKTISMLIEEVAAQRRLTEKALDQNKELLAILANKG